MRSIANCWPKSTSGWIRLCRRSSAASRQGRPLAFPECAHGTSSSPSARPSAYLLFEGKRLILPTGGKGQHKRFPNVLAALAEVPPCGFREVAISRDARGHYHASFVYEAPEAEPQPGQVVAFDLGIKTLAVGANEQGRFYHIGGEKGHPWYVPSNWTRSAPSGTAAKRSPAGISTSPRCISGFRNRSATSVVTVC